MQITGKRIKELSVDIPPYTKPLIEDLQPSTKHYPNGNVCVSYGLGPAGYDVRLDSVYRTIKRTGGVGSGPILIDPHNHNEGHYEQHEIPKSGLILLPGDFILGKAVENVNLPSNLVGKCLTKSTYARAGIYILTTTLQPGFSGSVVLEIINLGPVPVVLHPNVGIAQFEFHELNEMADRYDGNYQNQVGVRLGMALGARNGISK